jgi:GMP synthase (glutamine-hydrolysing)
MGDGRTYDQACALRVVTSTDGMTADYYLFDRVPGSGCQPRHQRGAGINITSKPPGTIEGGESVPTTDKPNFAQLLSDRS